jgi:hypothetical protein
VELAEVTFSCVEDDLLFCKHLPCLVSCPLELDLLFYFLLSVVFQVLFQTWRRFWLCLCPSTRDLYHVVSHVVLLSRVEENLFLCKHLTWHLVIHTY